MGTLHFRVQRGARQRTCFVRGPHRWQDRARARSSQVWVGPCLRGGGHRIDVRSSRRALSYVHLVRGLTETTPLFVQLCGDGVDTEKCNFP
jgi:hypothetical protein